MQLTGRCHGAPLLRHVDVPSAAVRGPDAGEGQIADLIRRHGQVFVRPLNSRFITRVAIRGRPRP